MVWPVVILLPAAFIVSAVFTRFLIRFGHGMGTLDSPGAPGHDKVIRAIPNIGGIAIAWPLILAILAGAILINTSWALLVSIVPPLNAYEDRLQQTMPTIWAFAVGLLVLHVIGLLDDRRSLGAWPKLVIQLVVAIVLSTWFDVRLLRVIDDSLGIGPVPSIIVTSIWILTITNAINFMDNMDGLAGGVSAIAGVFLMAAALLNEQWFIAAAMAVLVGSILGFLVYNISPARIFMGDGGSLVIGFALAVLVARTTFYNPQAQDTGLGTGWYSVFMPLAILAVPLYDMVTVSILRISQGRSPLVGDQQHYSHRLVKRGLSRRGAVFVIWGVTAVTGISGVFLAHLAPWQAILVGFQIILILIMLAVLEHASRHSASEQQGE